MSNRYSAKNDKTLTRTQSAQGGFRPNVVRQVASGRKQTSAFRFSSNPTTSGHNSGYHEAVAPTNTVKLLAQRKRAATTSRMPSSKRGFHTRYSNKPIRESMVEPVVALSDAARTDTARTVLSVPGGGAAGHSGSGLKTTNQSRAHDFQRQTTMDMLSDPAMTREAASLVSASLVSISSAPGEDARQVINSKRMKDRQAMRAYERNRNEVKRRVDALYDRSSLSDRAIALKHTKKAMSRLGLKRRLDKKRGRSPEREVSGPTGDIFGGGYRSKKRPASNRSPSQLPPAKRAKKAKFDGRELLYVTQPLRAKRRK